MKTKLILFCGVAFVSLAQSPGTFTATGNMSTARTAHAATLLTNGKVLIAGGWAGDSTGWNAWATTELYDPSTGTFTATGRMTTARYFHTATLLPDGKVLITGGNNSIDGGCFCGPLATAELYDPSTGTFTATGDMTTARSDHTATLLNNGKVLIAGGPTNRSLASAELYDSSTRTFNATGDMHTARWGHRATLLPSGKVLIDGGYTPDRDSGASPELYDPATGTFSPTGESTYRDTFTATATLLTNGKVLETLEYSCDADDQAQLYDSAAGTFAATGKMTAARGYSTATLLPDGKVLIAGRADFPYHPGGSAELYDLATSAFNPASDTYTPREEGHTATLLPDGTVLLSGGWLCCGYEIATAEIYHPAVLVRSPMLLSLSGDGQGQGAILHASTHQVVSSSNPAVAVEALEFYGTGLFDRSVIPP